ncbi:NAD(P)/FAD-dependent oxidoreductase [Thomasclavelia sp.]|uniref:NAD(P)/FAD-dependent oxidoreductase n=1 Tax=Thomasclavelia sp. TaxID=3025757 RepID=UPI0025D7264A|nr:NAD(P)/FAD-dependent oxidoreductase [Thomasclavelia sp.]
MENILFTPMQINSIKIKNRFVMGPMKSRLTVNNEYDERGVAYYRERAAGNFGLLITEFLAIDPGGLGSEAEPGIWNDSFIPSLKKVTEAVHKEGAKIFAQIHHAGMISIINESNPKAKGPSKIIENGVLIEELNIKEIQVLIQKYVNAALRAKQAGFDGVEIHGAHGYLITQFLSKRLNKRIDDYGGNYENRFRIVFEIVKGIRKECGIDYPVSLRINACDGKETDDNTIDDTIVYAMLAKKAGIDVINVSINDSIKSYFVKPGFNASNSKKIKDAVDIPVMVVGRINSSMIANKIVSEKAADFVVLARESVADPHFPNKVLNGKEISIFHCAGCMQRCNPQIGCEIEDTGMSCIFNPFTGKESTWKLIPTKSKERIAVIGGGCTGLQASWILAKRGYDITVYEKSNHLGGLLYYAGIPKGKEGFHQEIQTLEALCKENGVNIHLNYEVNEKNINDIEADLFIIAIGSTPIIPNIKGIKENSITAQEVLAGNVNLYDKKIAVLGGGLVGCETAEYLTSKNNQVYIIEMKDKIAADMNPIVRKDFLKEINNDDIVVYTGMHIIEINDEQELIVKQNQEIKNIGQFDTYVLACGYKSNQVYDYMKNRKCVILGDAKQVSDAKHNIYFATKYALQYGGRL